jgi:glycosyltransferase involved in cell wall biosynthesis
VNKRILFIIPIFPESIQDDTIVPFVFQFCAYFKQKYTEIDIDVLTLNYPINETKYIIEGITVYSLRGGFNGKIKNGLTLFRGIIKGIFLQRKNRYNGILSFWYSQPAIIGFILKKVFNLKHYIWMQGQDVKPENKYLRYFPPKPNELITLGKKHQELLYQFHNILAHKTADVALNPKGFPKLNTEKRNIDIIGVGNLGPIKNYSKFIDIIFELKKSFPNINTTICGGGEEKELLQNKIEKLNLTNNVKLLGYTSNASVRKLMSNSKILLHTSVFEGSPLVIQEALYSGCHVVSTIDLIKEEKILRFYFCKEKKQISDVIISILNNNKSTVKRIKPFDIDDTAKIIYSLFF